MAPSFKISFPLPRRPSASPHTTPGSPYSSQINIDDSPLSHPGAKAEKVPGASEADDPKLKKKRSKKQIRKYPSFMSVTLSGVDAESVQSPDEFPFPGMHTPRELVSQPAQIEGRQGCSPLLGEQYMFDPTDRGILSNGSSRQARRAASSSTLRSHYDPKKSPLSISQQTSASSARDMALRKGFPPVSSPLSLDPAEAGKSTEPDGLHSRNLSADTKISGSSKLSGNSIQRINSIPRRRPSIMDPPTLYPNTNRGFHAVSPPPALIKAALPKPLGPRSQEKTSFSRPRWWAKIKPQTPPPIPIEDRQQYEDLHHNSPSFKLNVKKPKAKPVAGMRNWFDGLEDEGTSSDDCQDVEVSLYRIPEPYKSALSIQEIMAQGARSLQLTERKSSFSDQSEITTLSDHNRSLRFDSSPIRSLHSRSSSQALEEMSTPGSTPGSRYATRIQPPISSKASPLAIDLQSLSFLELSSSEDETESSSDAPYGRHLIRASIEKASYNTEVSIGNAQRAQPVKPRSVVNGRTRHFSSMSNCSEMVPPVPKIPERPSLSQGSSSVRWREMMEENAGSNESNIDSGEVSLSGSSDALSRRPRAKQNIRRSRLMKVSAEEEKLLEAMRGKRASIRQGDFDKGFKTAIQLQDMVARPKTAGADARACRSAKCGSGSSTSLLPQECAIKTSRTYPTWTASAEDLRAFPFPKVPSGHKSPPGLISPPKPSPSLSFSPSDIVPETPASHNSPITPPPGPGELGVHARGLMLSPARGIVAMNEINHERKRSLSSSVGEGDGLEHQAQFVDEGKVSRWAIY